MQLTALYILKMDNPAVARVTPVNPPEDDCIGPFETEEQRLIWANTRASIPHDNPRRQCVSLADPTVPVVAP